MEPIQTVFGVKVSTIIVSAIMAILAVLLDIKRYSLWTGLLAVAAGMAVAVVGTDAIIEGLSLPQSASYAVAGVLSIAGRNIIVWITVVSKDPMAAWSTWKTGGKPAEKK